MVIRHLEGVAGDAHRVTHVLAPLERLQTCQQRHVDALEHEIKRIADGTRSRPLTQVERGVADALSSGPAWMMIGSDWFCASP